MKCLVFSDSHGTCEPMCAALRMHPDAEVIFFLGDGLRDFDEVVCDVTRPLTVVAVQGNCDFYSLVRGAPVHKSEIISLEGHRIFCAHGDVYGESESGRRRHCSFRTYACADGMVRVRPDAAVSFQSRQYRCAAGRCIFFRYPDVVPGEHSFFSRKRVDFRKRCCFFNNFIV